MSYWPKRRRGPFLRWLGPLALSPLIVGVALSLSCVMGKRACAGEPDFGLADKTLVAWVTVGDPNSRGGSVLTIGTGDSFDGIIYGEQQPRKWMPGSEYWRRTQRDQNSWPVEHAASDELLQIAITYRGDRVSVYRNAEKLVSYQMPSPPAEFRRGAPVIFGWRHLGASAPGFYCGTIDDARIYERALTPEQLSALQPNAISDLKPMAWWDFEDDAHDKMKMFVLAELCEGARIENGRLHLDGIDDYLIAESHTEFSNRIHFRPGRGNFADPVPFFWQGDYHVFYLQGAVGKVPWQHIVSKNLVDWLELPTALVADGAADSADGQNMFTGCVIEHDGLFHLYYTGWNPRNPAGREFVMHATSDDLVKWKKIPEHAFTADGMIYAAPQDADFRDPFVFWNDEADEWWMLLCARAANDHRPVTGVYASTDLVRWEPRPPLCDGYSGTPECPDLFQIGDRWYLVVSPSANVTTYRTASSLAGPWSAAPGLPLDTPAFYAAKRQFDGRRHVLTGWIRDLAGPGDDGAYQWGGTQSIPRELYADADGTLCVRPVQEISEAYSNRVLDLSAAAPRLTRPEWQFRDGRLTGRGAAVQASFDVPDDCLVEMQVLLSADADFTMLLRYDPLQREGYAWTIRPDRQQIVTHGQGVHWPRTDCKLDVSKPIKIQAFARGNIIEVFVNERYACTRRAYGLRKGQLAFRLDAGEVEITDLTVHTEIAASAAVE